MRPSYVPRPISHPRIHIALVDDHPVVRAGILAELARHADICVVGEAADGDAALQLATTQALDVLITDIGMPGMPVTELVARVSTLSPAPRVIVLTAYTEPQWAIKLLRAGATAYILKDEALETLIAVVRDVAAGTQRVSASLLPYLLGYLTDDRQSSTVDLSPREQQVLAHLIEGKGNREIGQALNISERTVCFHLRNIYDKLGVQRRAEAVAWGVRNNMVYRD